jgi:DNA-binding response OmpR family regulator
MAGSPIPLTVTEFRLVSRLVDRLGEVVDRTDLLAFAWPGVDRPDPLWLKPHMARLRSKLIAAGAPVPVPIRGVGYRLDDAEPEPEPAGAADPDGDGTVASPASEWSPNVGDL